MTERRFPPPWNGACFIVKDTNGQALGYVYCRESYFLPLRASRYSSKRRRFASKR